MIPKTQKSTGTTRASSAFLYDQIERSICERIVSGKLRPGDLLEAPDKLMAMYSVSHGTLRHALQNLAARGILVRRPKAGTFIHPELDMDQVVSLLRSIGTEENSPPSAIPAPSQANAIGMIVPDLQMFEFATVARGVESAVEAAGLNLMIGNSDDQQDRLERIIQQQLRAGIGGLIIATGRHLTLSFDVIRAIKSAGVPVVNCYRPVGLVEWPVIRASGATNIHQLALHLCDIGRKRIAYFDFNVEDVPEIMLKREGRWGFMSALLSRGVVPDPDNYLEYPRDVQSYGEGHYIIEPSEVRFVADWFKKHRDVDAILCVHDRLAAIVVAALKELKRSIPQQVAVAGAGHSGERFGFRKEWLTSIDVRFPELGIQACDLIFRQQRGEAIPPGTVILVPGDLCIGESTVSGSA